jgi:hypothetical protein
MHPTGRRDGALSALWIRRWCVDAARRSPRWRAQRGEISRLEADLADHCGETQVMKRARRLELQDRILRNSFYDVTTGCRLWTARINNQGYPVMSTYVKDRKRPVKMFAHRVSLEVFSRPPKDGEVAAHAVKCPNRHWVAREHLRWATQEENEADKRRARRLMLREVHPPIHALGLAE